MTELDLYKFINDNVLEYHWIPVGESDRMDVILFVENHVIREWHRLLCDSIFDEEGLDCVMKDGYFCFYMEQICEYHEVLMEDVFPKDGEI